MLTEFVKKLKNLLVMLIEKRAQSQATAIVGCNKLFALVYCAQICHNSAITISFVGFSIVGCDRSAQVPAKIAVWHLEQFS
jgi:hypothetical protein